MNLNEIVYLKNILGEKEAKCFIQADEEKLKMLVKVLKRTSLKRILSLKWLCEFCHAMAFGKYGRIFAEVLCEIGKFKGNCSADRSLFYILYEFFKKGYIDEYYYKQLFMLFEHFNGENYSFNFDYDHVKILVDDEIKRVNEEKVTVAEFLKSGGSLEELIEVMNKYEIKDFNCDTKIPITDFTTFKLEKYLVNPFQLSYLVANMPNLNLGKKLEQELLESYYEYLQQNKKNAEKMTTFIIENKPRLYKLLKENGFMVIKLDDKKEDEIINQLKKKN